MNCVSTFLNQSHVSIKHQRRLIENYQLKFISYTQRNSIRTKVSII